jgi:hypothetical protein
MISAPVISSTPYIIALWYHNFSDIMSQFYVFIAVIMVPARLDGAACGRHAPAAPPPPASPSHAKRRCIEAIGASSMDLEFKLEWYYSSSCGTGPGHGQPTARPVGGEMLKLLLCTGDRTVLSLATQIEGGCLVVASSFKSSLALRLAGSPPGPGRRTDSGIDRQPQADSILDHPSFMPVTEKN